jgi:hypothetical protein
VEEPRVADVARSGADVGGDAVLSPTAPYVALTTMPTPGWIRARVVHGTAEHTLGFEVEADRSTGAWSHRSDLGTVSAWQPELGRAIIRGRRFDQFRRGYANRPMSDPARMLWPLGFPIWGRTRQSDQFEPVAVRREAHLLRIDLASLDGSLQPGSALLHERTQILEHLFLHGERWDVEEVRHVTGPSIAIPDDLPQGR